MTYKFEAIIQQVENKDATFIEIRKKIDKGIGDTVSVEIEKDEEERIVEIPIEFESMLNKNNNAKEFYGSLSYSQKKKYITWITSAKHQLKRKKLK